MRRGAVDCTPDRFLATTDGHPRSDGHDQPVAVGIVANLCDRGTAVV